jgi:hypothetical protein
VDGLLFLAQQSLSVGVDEVDVYTLQFLSVNTFIFFPQKYVTEA